MHIVLKIMIDEEINIHGSWLTYLQCIASTRRGTSTVIRFDVHLCTIVMALNTILWNNESKQNWLCTYMRSCAVWYFNDSMKAKYGEWCIGGSGQLGILLPEPMQFTSVCKMYRGFPDISGISLGSNYRARFWTFNLRVEHASSHFVKDVYCNTDKNRISIVSTTTLLVWDSYCYNGEWWDDKKQKSLSKERGEIRHDKKEIMRRNNKAGRISSPKMM